MFIQCWIDGWCLVIPLYQEIGCQRGVASDNHHLVSLVLAVVCKTCWRLCWALKKRCSHTKWVCILHANLKRQRHCCQVTQTLLWMTTPWRFVDGSQMPFTSRSVLKHLLSPRHPTNVYCAAVKLHGESSLSLILPISQGRQASWKHCNACSVQFLEDQSQTYMQTASAMIYLLLSGWVLKKLPNLNKVVDKHPQHMSSGKHVWADHQTLHINQLQGLGYWGRDSLLMLVWVAVNSTSILKIFHPGSVHRHNPSLQRVGAQARKYH